MHRQQLLRGQQEEYRVCTRCVMDTSDPAIAFDSEGACNYCAAAIQRLRRLPSDANARQERLKALLSRIKADGKGKDYDCVIGVSGGVDSSFVAREVRRLGLRPIAVHFDNGWDSEIAVDNIRRVLELLGIELLTYVVDWEEFRDLQLSFLKSSTANCEIPTDHAIFATLFRTAAQFRLKYILTGSNLATEAIYSVAGGGHYHQDFRHIRAIHRRFGSRALRTYPSMSLRGYLYHVFGRGVRQIPFLNLVEYDRQAAQGVLRLELGWRDYGAKHCESVWTRFFQGYYLPTKFGCDKRKWHLSSMICAGQISRERALEVLATPIYDDNLLRQDTEFVLKKFGLTADEFDALMSARPARATDFPSHAFVLYGLEPLKNAFRSIATHS